MADPVITRAPWLTCVDATLTIVDQRVEHLTTALRAINQGRDPRSLPRVPTAPGLSAC